MSHLNKVSFYPSRIEACDPAELSRLHRKLIASRMLVVLATAGLVAGCVVVVATNSFVALMAVVAVLAFWVIALVTSAECSIRYQNAKARADYITRKYEAVKALPSQIDREFYMVLIVQEENDALGLVLKSSNENFEVQAYRFTPTSAEVVQGSPLGNLIENLELIAQTDRHVDADLAVQERFRYRSRTPEDVAAFKAWWHGGES